MGFDTIYATSKQKSLKSVCPKIGVSETKWWICANSTFPCNTILHGETEMCMPDPVKLRYTKYQLF